MSKIISQQQLIDRQARASLAQVGDWKRSGQHGGLIIEPCPLCPLCHSPIAAFGLLKQGTDQLSPLLDLFWSVALRLYQPNAQPCASDSPVQLYHSGTTRPIVALGVEAYVRLTYLYAHQSKYSSTVVQWYSTPVSDPAAH